MERVAENLWTQQYPLNMGGGHQDRIVTFIRLKSGDLILHSTGPFTQADFVEIKILGKPAWMVDTMLRHDTFSKQARQVFPDIPYLAPEGFADAAALEIKPLLPVPAAWTPEVEVLLIEGMPAVKEHVFLHMPTRTLIVADLVFNFEHASWWTNFFRKTVMGVKSHPDSARLYPLQIKDRAAYDRSIRDLMTRDFDRIIVGHNAIVETDGKHLLAQALANKGMLPK